MNQSRLDPVVDQADTDACNCRRILRREHPRLAITARTPLHGGALATVDDDNSSGFYRNPGRPLHLSLPRRPAEERMSLLLPRSVPRIRIPDANKLLWAALEGKGVSGSKSFVRAQFFINSFSMGS
jgi:hypothetical protein